MNTLYGISNCDTVRKARKWLETHGVPYRFHDFRRDGIDAALVSTWLDQISGDTLVNRRGTTWRQLSDDERARARGAGLAELLATHPTLIKRPVLVGDGLLEVGFDPERYGAVLK